MLKTRAAVVLVVATKRQTSIFPECYSSITSRKIRTCICSTDYKDSPLPSPTPHTCDPPHLHHVINHVTLIPDFQIHSPLTPFGMQRKSSLPNAFWLALKVQLSVPVKSISPLVKDQQSQKINPREVELHTWPASS